MDEGDMFWKRPARIEMAAGRKACGGQRLRRRRAAAGTAKFKRAAIDHSSECPDAGRFRKAVRPLIGDRRYANLIDPLTIRVHGNAVQLIGSHVQRDCLEPYGPALGRAAVQVLGEAATCTFIAVPVRRAA